MDCPQCKGYKLEPAEIEPGLVAGVCPKCDGAMLSLMNYRYWMDQYGRVDDVDGEAVITEDNGQVKVCPKCSRFMTKFQVGSATNNRIDLCTGCDEAWLDKGEWRLLKQLDLHDKLPKIFTDAWQRNIRIQRQEERFKERYQDILGAEDFSKLDNFKVWLDGHAEKSHIKHYLITKFD